MPWTINKNYLKGFLKITWSLGFRSQPHLSWDRTLSQPFCYYCSLKRQGHQRTRPHPPVTRNEIPGHTVMVNSLSGWVMVHALFWVLLCGYSCVRFTSDSVGWVKQDAFPFPQQCGWPQAVGCSSEQKTKCGTCLKKGDSLLLNAFQLGLWLFPLFTWNWILAPLGSGASQLSNRFYTISSSNFRLSGNYTTGFPRTPTC